MTAFTHLVTHMRIGLSEMQQSLFLQMLPIMSIAGAMAMVEQLLKAGCEVDAPTNDAWTALHEAASNGHVRIVECLLTAGAQVQLTA